MAQPMPTVPQGRGSSPPGRVDPRRLWSGGVATAVVAGLVALTSVLVCRWLFRIPLLSPERDGTYGDAHTTMVVLLAAAAALIATALCHLLLLGTPRPLTFFSWIVALATVLVAILPFQTSAPLSAKVATAVVTGLIGIAIGSLLYGVATRSVRPAVPGSSAPVGRVSTDTPTDSEY